MGLLLYTSPSSLPIGIVPGHGAFAWRRGLEGGGNAKVKHRSNVGHEEEVECLFPRLLESRGQAKPVKKTIYGI